MSSMPSIDSAILSTPTVEGWKRQDFLPTGPCPAPIMIVGEAPGKTEVEQGMPFVGASGYELDRLLGAAGIPREACFVTNVCRVRPPNNDIEQYVSSRKTRPDASWSLMNGKWVSPEIVFGLTTLEEEISRVQPNLIICFGNLALWAVTGKWGVKSWRGCILASGSISSTPGKVLCTYHPSAILRQNSLRPTVQHDLKKAATEYLSSEMRPGRETSFLIRPTKEQVLERISLLIREADDIAALECAHYSPLKLAPDIETRAGHIACLGFAWSRTEAICIPFMDTAHPTGYWSLEDEIEIVCAIRRLFTHPAVDAVGQNWLYDAQYFWRHWHFIVPRIRDTMIAQHAMFSSGQKGLDYLASLYDPDYVYWKDDGKNWDPSVPEEQLWTYNCMDCIETYIVDEGQAQARLDLEPRWPKVHEVNAFQQALFLPVLKMMNRGIRPHLERKAKMATELMAAAEARQAWINEVVGRPLNVGSNKQMQEFFYEELALTRNYNRGKPGEPMRVTCDDAALEKIQAREPLLRPLIRTIQEMRSAGVYLKTFVSMTLDVDGRIRCTINIAGTITYRFSSSRSAFDCGTNLQNVPSGDELEEGFSLPNVRKFFIPDPGMEIFDIDLDSADVRIVAKESNCIGLQQYFDAGLKPYVEVAKEYYRDPTINKHHRSYKRIKSLCNGTNYLGTPPGLASRIGLLVHDVERIQQWYFGKFPEIKQWQDDLKAQILGRGYIQNVFGERCHFRERITDKTFNEGVAWIPQSSVGRVINTALINIDGKLPWAQLLLQVHDSLVGQYPAHMGGVARRSIIEQATITLPYNSPLTIPAGLKVSQSSWGECESVKTL